MFLELFFLLQLVLTEIYYDGFHRTFHDERSLSEIRVGDNVYAIEMPNDECNGSEQSSAIYQSSQDIVLLILNKTGVGTNSKR